MQRVFTVLIVLIGLVGWTGCDSFSSSSTMPNNEQPSEEVSPSTSGQGGHINVYLTDAPGNIAEAFVTVKRVELLRSDKDSIVVLSDSARTFDLLTLQNGVTETLADTTLPLGTYRQIRFITGNDPTIRLDDGTMPRLKVPSGPQTGIKIVLPEFTVDSEQDTVDVTLDFSVEDSFVKAGRSGMYIFKPTVKAEAVVVNGEEQELVEVSGEVTALDAEAGTFEVDGIPFTVTDQTRIENVSGEATLADFATGDFVDVSGTRRDDGSLVARKVEAQEEGEAERSVEALVDAVGASSITVLETEFTVNDETEFENLSGLADLQEGDRVEIAYDVVDDALVALKIERDEAGQNP